MKHKHSNRNTFFCIIGIFTLSIGLGLGVSTGYSSWKDVSNIPQLTVNSGNLEISETSKYTYTEESKDIESIKNLDSVDEVLSVPMAPGDVLVSETKFTTNTDGDNLHTVLTVNTSKGIDDQYGNTTIELIDSKGNVKIGPNNIGENIVVENPNNETWTLRSTTTFHEFDDSPTIRKIDNVSYTATLQQDVQ